MLLGRLRVHGGHCQTRVDWNGLHEQRNTVQPLCSGTLTVELEEDSPKLPVWYADCTRSPPNLQNGSLSSCKLPLSVGGGTVDVVGCHEGSSRNIGALVV